MSIRNNDTFKRLEEVFAAGRDAEEERTQNVRILIAVDAEAPRDFVESLKEALIPAKYGVVLDVRLVGDVAMDPNGFWDACIIIAGGTDDAVSQAAINVGRHGNPVVVVAQSVLDIPEVCLNEPVSAFVSTIAASNQRALLHDLSNWLLQSSAKSTAIAASFPFCRKARVRELARGAAAANAAIGVVNLLPGSDFPYMVVNQAKLALDIAAVYGQRLSFARLPELVGVVGAGLGYRFFAKMLLGLIPAVGPVIKGATAYAGTMSTAEALSAHFQLGEGDEHPVDVIRDDLRERMDEIRETIPNLPERLRYSILGDRNDDGNYGDDDYYDEDEYVEEPAAPAEQMPQKEYIVYMPVEA